jgi:hypothetical protein
MISLVLIISASFKYSTIILRPSLRPIYNDNNNSDDDDDDAADDDT